MQKDVQCMGRGMNIPMSETSSGAHFAKQLSALVGPVLLCSSFGDDPIGREQAECAN